MIFNKYNDKEIKELLESLTIIYDTREQVGKNDHILNYFTDKGIKYERRKLEFGDYTAYIPKNESLGIPRDLTLERIISVERKMGLGELSNNLCQKRKQFEAELSRSKGKLILMVEGASYDDIVRHKYNTKFTPLSYIASLRSFQARYSNLHLEFTSKALAGNSIYYNIYYHAMELLKNGGSQQ